MTHMSMIRVAELVDDNVVTFMALVSFVFRSVKTIMWWNRTLTLVVECKCSFLGIRTVQPTKTDVIFSDDGFSYLSSSRPDSKPLSCTHSWKDGARIIPVLVYHEAVAHINDE